MRLVAARDWVQFPAIVERNAPATVFALGDIHGDYERMIRVMTAAHIIAGADSRWAAGPSVLVVTGDMIDKGPRSVDVLLFLKQLRIQAAGSGGAVIVLAGNHEAEFLASPGQKKAVDFMSSLEQAGVSVADTGACKGEEGEFLCSLPFGARVGDTFFAHAGDTGGATLRQLSSAIEKAVDKGGYDAKELIGPAAVLEARLPESVEEQLLMRQAAAIGVKRIVQGHQPGAVRFADGVERRRGEMMQRWGVRYLIDTGMSRGVGDSQGAILRLSQGQAVGICPDGKETVLWTEVKNEATGRMSCPN